MKDYKSEVSEAAKRYSEIAIYLGSNSKNVRSNVKYLINKIVSLQKTLNMPKNLKETKIDLSNFEDLKFEMAEIALNDKCTLTNPIKPTKEDIVKILDRVKE